MGWGFYDCSEQSIAITIIVGICSIVETYLCGVIRVVENIAAVRGVVVVVEMVCAE